jgi:hemerythrin-like metal-binding protein
MDTQFYPQNIKMNLESKLIMDYQNSVIKREPLQWSGRFSVGIKELDFQHLKLINLLNRLILVSETNSIHSEIIKSILEEMTTYAQVHFTTEEKLMETYDFPQIKEHKKRHLDFQVKTMDLYEELGKNTEQQAGVLYGFLTDWWTHHILQEDMAYKEFFIDKGLR